MIEVDVEFWRSEDNYEDCGEVGVSAVCDFTFPSRLTYTYTAHLLRQIEREAFHAFPSAHVEVDGDTLYVHYRPDDVEYYDEDGVELDPEEILKAWAGDDTKFIRRLQQGLHRVLGDRGYRYAFRDA